MSGDLSQPCAGSGSVCWALNPASLLMALASPRLRTEAKLECVAPRQSRSLYPGTSLGLVWMGAGPRAGPPWPAPVSLGSPRHRQTHRNALSVKPRLPRSKGDLVNSANSSPAVRHSPVPPATAEHPSGNPFLKAGGRWTRQMVVQRLPLAASAQHPLRVRSGTRGRMGVHMLGDQRCQRARRRSGTAGGGIGLGGWANASVAAWRLSLWSLPQSRRPPLSFPQRPCNLQSVFRIGSATASESPYSPVIAIARFRWFRAS